jgi:Icc-related predicted phosphoesterase
VETHHAPSINSISSKYNESRLSAGFASNLDDFINERDIDLWLHGHTHNSCDYMIGKTRVVSNQRGYPNEENNELFNENFIIEI